MNNLVLSESETAIIRMLDMDFDLGRSESRVTYGKAAEGEGEHYLDSPLEDLPSKVPQKCLIPHGNDRYYTESINYTPYSVRKVIGDSLEVLFADYENKGGRRSKWMMIEKTDSSFGLKKHTYPALIKAPYSSYISHFRLYDDNYPTYIKKPFIIKDNKILSPWAKNAACHKGFRAVMNDTELQEIDQNVRLMVSIKEDFIRVDSFIVDLKNIDTNLISSLCVERDRLSELLFLRDNPLTQTGRKRPIIHWVSNHLRNTKHKSNIRVIKHLRGITRFDLDGFNVTITPNTAEESRKMLP